MTEFILILALCQLDFRELAPASAAGVESTTAPTPPAVQTVSVRDALDSYISTGGRQWYVRGKTIKAHMIQDHGWTADQLVGLSQRELLYLHGATHEGKIDPDEYPRVVAQPVGNKCKDAVKGGYPVTFRSDGRWYWNHPRRGWRYTSSKPIEGAVYYDLIYSDGRMHEQDEAPAQSEKPVIYIFSPATWNCRYCNQMLSQDWSHAPFRIVHRRQDGLGSYPVVRIPGQRDRHGYMSVSNLTRVWRRTQQHNGT